MSNKANEVLGSVFDYESNALRVITQNESEGGSAISPSTGKKLPFGVWQDSQFRFGQAYAQIGSTIFKIAVDRA